MTGKRSLFAASFLIAVLFTLPVSRASESILSFDSLITVHRDATLSVAETIKVNAENDQIRHGIYRDFPTKYTMYKNGTKFLYVVGFTVKEVLRDGAPEPHHIALLTNGKRLYIGDENSWVRPGIHTYTIKYDTNRQLGFFKDHDELYWNVTGNGWDFPILNAFATVVLPAGISRDAIKTEGYTGPQGSYAKDLNMSFDSESRPVFTTTQLLYPHSGLSIVAGWPKGFVHEPTVSEKCLYFLRDNIGMAVGALGVIVLFAYFVITWALFGRNPPKGTIIPLFAPPRGVSPSAVRYIMNMGYDNKCFSAAIINMAVKGYFTITEKDGVYSIDRGDADSSNLSPEEKVIAKELMKARTHFKFESANYDEVKDAIDSLKDTLKLEFEKTYFFTNVQYFIPGAVISILIILAAALSSLSDPLGILGLGFISIWLSVWTVGVSGLLYSALLAWKKALFVPGGKALDFGGAIILSLFCIPFVGGEILGLFFLAHFTSVYILALFIILAALNFIFYQLLKAPTLAGRTVMDQIEGFGMYLRTAEKDEIAGMGAPAKTPELFEKYLPYAVALDLENAWAKKFTDVLARAGAGGKEYSPAWYCGSTIGVTRIGGITGFSSLGGSLASSIASSAVAPGSSSGFSGGGGGFGGGGGGGGSGGGGGGGGGGGW